MENIYPIGKIEEELKKHPLRFDHTFNMLLNKVIEENKTTYMGIEVIPVKTLKASEIFITNGKKK